MKHKTNLHTKDIQGKNINPQIEVGPFKGHISGDLLDANATEALMDKKVSDVVDGATSAADTLKEIEDRLNTLAMSQINNDSGYVQQDDNGQLKINETNITIVSNQPFPSSWPTSSSYTLQNLVDAIDADQDAVQGKVYMATVHYNDLNSAVGLADGELKVEIMSSTGSHKIARFTITSANASPYYWQNTMWDGQLHNVSNVTGKKWVSFATSQQFGSLDTQVQNIQGLITRDPQELDTAIDKFEEIVDFLDNVESTTLNGILSNFVRSTDITDVIRSNDITDVVRSSSITNMVNSTSVRNIVVLTQQQYTDLATKDPNTEYNIV